MENVAFFWFRFTFSLLFAALPKSGPEITGGHLRYNPNDLVNVTCTTKESKPAAQLHWMINGEPADPKYIKGPYKQFVGREGLETTSLSKPNFSCKVHPKTVILLQICSL